MGYNSYEYLANRRKVANDVMCNYNNYISDVARGGRWGRSGPGSTFWGAAKLRLCLKTKNREDLKRSGQKIGVGGKK